MSGYSRILVISMFLGLGFVTGGAHASVSALPANLVEVGSGEMRWLGMEVYDARLLSGGERFSGDFSSGPVALEITYRRNIPSDRLVRTTEREWQRLRRELQLPEAPRVRQWLGEIATIWPDVTPGDRLIALVEPAGETRFYGNDGLLGVVNDPDFGPAFLGIWLHPATRAAELRAELLGPQQ
jgi:hypothetical protein